MRYIEAGEFTMGSTSYYPEEAPLRKVRLGGFWIDETPVTNREFARFVEETGYVTLAEKPPEPNDYPGIRPEMAKAGSLVFFKPTSFVSLHDPRAWWRFEFGANWCHPLGPGSSITGLDDHPVVHVAWHDAANYASWVGKDLPTEAQWEYAARGGLLGADYAWGDELAPKGVMMANYWQGLFPVSNQCLDGWERTSPVRSFPPNGFGLYDMIGNVWEWTKDWWSSGLNGGRRKAGSSCCVVSNPRGAKLAGSFDPMTPDIRIGRKVLKGGSHLCSENYCQRYRPAARHPETIDSSTSHIGFRCVSNTKPINV